MQQKTSLMSARTAMWLFTAISLTPLILLIFAGLTGGALIWLSLGYMTLLAAGFDRLIDTTTAHIDAEQIAMPANILSVCLALGHFGALAVVVQVVIDSDAAPLSARIALFFAAGLFFGQVSNSNAHELIHRPSPQLYWLGAAVYASLFFGHHASAHIKVHHRFAATAQDPNSARKDEGFYRFALRAWAGSFRAGYVMEKSSNIRKIHPYIVYFSCTVLTVIGALSVGGTTGIVALLALAIYAQIQLLLSDYVQHYGLHRKHLSDGKPEPLNLGHSGNSPHFFTSFLMLNAPRHSDHHAHATRPYPALRMPTKGQAPILPHSLAVMAVLALFPPIWRRIMRRELEKWREEQAQAG